MTGQSIATMAEADTVRELAGSAFHRLWALNVDGIPSDGEAYCSVALAGLRKAKGDIDILVVPPGRAHEACAVQVKKIKVDSDGLRTGRPNNMGSLKKGVQQTNLLVGLGFHRVYLFVLVVADAREQNAGRVGYDGLSAELDRLIRQWIRPEGLAPRAGLFHLEMVQTLERGGPLESGTSSVRLIQPGGPVTQSADVTEWVRQVDARSRPTTR